MCPQCTIVPSAFVRGTGSLKLTTPDKPLRRRHSNVLARNQLSPFAGTLSSSTKRPSSTLSKGLRGNTEVSVAPSEGAIMAAPEGAKAPLVDGSEDARRHGTQPVMVMRTNQARSQGERKEKQGAAAPCAAINS